MDSSDRVTGDVVGYEQPYGRRLVVMVKEPVAGRVKSRLAQDIGDVRAVSFYRTVLRNVLSRVVQPYRWQTYLAIAPKSALGSNAWPEHLMRVYQGEGDLGHRMQAIMDGMPPGPVVIIGSDIPGIRANDVAAAFQELGSHDAVLGPSPDGGYWLVGLKRTPKVCRIFEGVRWSHKETLNDTVEVMRSLRVGFVEMLDDVDTGKEYRQLRAGEMRRVLGQM